MDQVLQGSNKDKKFTPITRIVENQWKYSLPVHETAISFSMTPKYEILKNKEEEEEEKKRKGKEKKKRKKETLKFKQDKTYLKHAAAGLFVAKSNR